MKTDPKPILGFPVVIDPDMKPGPAIKFGTFDVYLKLKLKRKGTDD